MGIIERFGRIADVYVSERDGLIEGDQERRRTESTQHGKQKKARGQRSSAQCEQDRPGHGLCYTIDIG